MTEHDPIIQVMSDYVPTKLFKSMAKHVISRKEVLLSCYHNLNGAHFYTDDDHSLDKDIN